MIIYLQGYYIIILLQTVLMQHEKIYSQLISKVHVTSNEHDSFTQNYPLSDIFRTFCNSYLLYICLYTKRKSTSGLS